MERAKPFIPPKQIEPISKRIIKPLDVKTSPIINPVVTNATADQVERLLDVVSDMKMQQMTLKRKCDELDKRLMRIEGFMEMPPIFEVPHMTGDMIIIDDDLCFTDAQEFNRWYQELHKY